MTVLDLQAIRTTAEKIAQEAGREIIRYAQNGFNLNTKSSDVDIVTEADKATEALIVSHLLAAFPDHHIVGEEGGGMGAPVETAAYRWYVDPIDGTTNFANGIPMYAVSLALTDAAMTPLVGVVYNPAMVELFSAAQGFGATLNGESIYVSEEKMLSRCVLASGFPYDKYTSPDNNLDEWGRMLVRTRGLRRMGSAALDCCYVAAGRFDGYWEQKLHPWDVLAGLLCVTEAGGIVSDYQGNSAPGWISRGKAIASNGRIHSAIMDVLAMDDLDKHQA